MASTSRSISRLARVTSHLTPRTIINPAPNRLRQFSQHIINKSNSTPHQSKQKHLSTMSTTPSTMRGVQISRLGGPEVLEYSTQLPVPKPGAGEILIKNEYIGINFIDTYFRTGLYPAKLPMTLGREAAGTIVAIGEGSASGEYALKEGDKVIYMAGSAYAEYTSVPAIECLAIPAGVSTETAAASWINGLTAITMIEESHKVVKGDWVLVPAAAGGTGGWLCKLLKQRGVHVIGTASTEEKRVLARENGAEVVVGYEDVLATVKEKTGGKGVRAVFDGVGKATFQMALDAVARKGSIVSFGNASGAVEPVVLRTLSAKNIKLLRPTVMNYLVEREEKEFFAKLLWTALENGLKVDVWKTYGLHEIQQAHKDLEGRVTTGKLLVKP